MTRRDRPRRSLRGPAVVEPRKRILVVCVGKVTEPRYVMELKEWKKTPTVEVIVEGEAGDPVTQVKLAKSLKAQAESEAVRREDDTYRFDEVWCCFDVDRFENVKEARDMADANGIKLAMSNPCFELWLYLHFKDSPGMRGHHEMQHLWKELDPELPEKHIAFEKLKPGYEDAVSRAKRIHDDARAAAEPTRNPTTEVYLLALSIDGEGREKRESMERERREQERNRGLEQAKKAEADAWKLVEEQARAEASSETDGGE